MKQNDKFEDLKWNYDNLKKWNHDLKTDHSGVGSHTTDTKRK